jgi:4-azaleucine resistance transporter AzlC
VYRHDLRQGIAAAMPVVLGYLPLGFAFGVLARGAGLSVLEVFAMSLLVYAGSAQFIAVGLLSTGAGGWTIVVTTFLVNLRHLLMSASLTPYLRKVPVLRAGVLAYELTDESYAVAMGHFARHEPKEGFLWGLFPTCQLGWIISTVLGAWVGNLIPNPEAFGLDYALTAMFICLLIFQLRDKSSYLSAVLAGGLALLIYIWLPGRWNIIIATVLAATIGVVVEQWKKS